MNNEKNFNNNNLNNNLPTQNDNDNNQKTSSNNKVQEKIEIPQAYYDQKKEKERALEEQKIQEQMEREQQKINNAQSSNLLMTLIIFGVLTYLCMSFAPKKGEVSFIVMFAIIVLSSIISGIANKKKTNIPDGVLAGGIMCAAITFVISMIKNDNSELWIYYAIGSGIIAIAGYIISKLITSIIVDNKNIKAVQTIGIFLVLGGLIGTPIYLKQKYPEEFARYVLNRSREIVAESELDFVEKTLKNRYGKDFTCGNKKTAMDYVVHTMVSRYMCFDEVLSDTELDKRLKNASYDSGSNDYVIVSSIPYNENELKFIIEDDYLDKLYLDEIKELISNALGKKIPESKFKISLYPNGNCLFVGDCADCEEYYEVGDYESQLDVRYETSTNLDYSKDMNMSAVEFINKHEYKYLISISGFYSSYFQDNYEPTVATAIEVLNSLNLDNNFGYEITLKNSTEYNKEVYKVIGYKSSDKKFNKPDEVKIYDAGDYSSSSNNNNSTTNTDTPSDQNSLTNETETSNEEN